MLWKKLLYLPETVMFWVASFLFIGKQRIKNIKKHGTICSKNFFKRIFFRLLYIHNEFRKKYKESDFAIKMLWVSTSPLVSFYTLCFGKSIKKIQFLKKENLEGKNYEWKKRFMFVDIVLRVHLWLLSFIYTDVLQEISKICTFQNMKNLWQTDPLWVSLIVLLVLLSHNSSKLTIIYIYIVDKKERKELLETIRKNLQKAMAFVHLIPSIKTA